MKKAISLFTIVLAVFFGVRADEEASDILERVRDHYDEIDDAEISFNQEVTFARTQLEQKTTGKLFLRKPDQYRLEISDQTIVTDGTTVWSYTRSAGQVIIDLVKLDERSLTPEKLLTGSPGDFTPSFIGREQLGDRKCAVVKLTPKSEGLAVTSLKLWVDEDDWIIRRAEVIEFSGKKTLYTIRDLKENTGLEGALFSFTPPEGAEVVDLR